MEQPTCPVCGETLGVYEPIRVALADATEQSGSRLTLAASLERPGSIAAHEHCYARAATPIQRRLVIIAAREKGALGEK